MAELADAPDLGSGGFPVQVQVLSPAPKNSFLTFSVRKGFFCLGDVVRNCTHFRLRKGSELLATPLQSQVCRRLVSIVLSLVGQAPLPILLALLGLFLKNSYQLFLTRLPVARTRQYSTTPKQSGFVLFLYKRLFWYSNNQINNAKKGGTRIPS